MMPQPESLPKEIWKNEILAHMSFFFEWEGQSDYQYANQNFYRKKGQLPMNDKTWALIESYYVNNSPQEIPVRVSEKLDIQPFFEEVLVDQMCHTPSVSALFIDEEQSIYCSCTNLLVKLEKLEQLDTVVITNSTISQIKRYSKHELLLLNAGELGPHDLPKGTLNVLNELTSEEEVILSQLHRPVYLSEVGDDYFISEFGHNKGRLSIFNKGTKEKETIVNLPGSYRTIEADIDNDGTAELVVQISQSAEGIYTFSKAGSKMDYDRILSFPPEYGLSDIDIADMDNDGFLDLIIANGDNADISYFEKAYHGVRIFLNDQLGNFTEEYFYPMYGATQVNVLDIDGDEKLDLVASSFFPHDIEQSIIILHQISGTLNFKDYSVDSAYKGRWMVMENGDVDQDGDVDVVLGAFTAGPTNIKNAILQNWIQESVDMLILKNMQIN